VRHEARLTSPVCEYCVSGTSCDHGAGANPASACACSLSGTKKCPGCGCECATWDWGLGFEGPATVRSFFGVGDDENPGFSEYPASKRQILTAATQELQEGEANPADIAWLARSLPEATYPDRGAVLAALCPVISWPGTDTTVVVAPLSMHAIAAGTRLVVGRDQLALLVGKNGKPLDAFGPGEYTLTNESAPRSAAESRPAAPGFPRSVITATPFFAATRETHTALSRTGRTRSGEPLAVRGTLTFSIVSLADFLPHTGSRGRSFSAKDMETAVAGIVGPALDQTIGAHDSRELVAPSKFLEESIRKSAGQAGLRVSAVSFDSVGAVSRTDQMAAMQKAQMEALSHMPPEVQARVKAQMAIAMERRAQASRATPSGSLAVGTVAATAPGPAPPAGSQVCPSCQAPNPPTVRFCGNCGKPLSTKRTCPRCSSEVPAGVKFCGNCGGPVT